MPVVASKGFTLTELIIGTLLVGLVILASASAEIVSRRYYTAAEDVMRIQEEAENAMQYFAKYLPQGIAQGAGSSVQSGFTLYGPTNRIRVKIDGLVTGVCNGQYGDANDGEIEFEFNPTSYKIIFDPLVNIVASDKRDITLAVIANCSFQTSSDLNRVDIYIQARRKPSIAASPDNPEVILTSSIALRSMPAN